VPCLRSWVTKKPGILHSYADRCEDSRKITERSALGAFRDQIWSRARRSFFTQERHTHWPRPQLSRRSRLRHRGSWNSRRQQNWHEEYRRHQPSLGTGATSEARIPTQAHPKRTLEALRRGCTECGTHIKEFGKTRSDNRS
jgi:hypothetical protein